ncbi:MAG: hypothetical protein JW903_07235, partial [Clostridia bacterium]|nr:hypothetical protein [Clostridia bacterium]
TVMLLEKTREFIGKSKLNTIIFWVLVIGILIGYFSIFFQRGIEVEDNFLIKHKSEGQILYKGSDFWGDLKVFVAGVRNKDASANIIYELPGNIQKYYTVYLEEADNWYAGVKKIEDGTGNTLFEGYSSHNGSWVDLYNTDGSSAYFMGEPKITVTYSNSTKSSPYTQDYSIALRIVAGVAIGTEEHSRGDFVLLLAAVLIMCVVLLDFFMPLLFFELKTVFLTDDAEPSDIYIFFQRMRWNIFPLLSVGLLIAALFAKQ